jgi:hypothetical protein
MAEPAFGNGSATGSAFKGPMKPEADLIAEWANEELLAAVRAPADDRPSHLARGRLYLDMLSEGLDGGAWLGPNVDNDTCSPRGMA